MGRSAHPEARARALELFATGMNCAAVAAEVGAHPVTVRRWQQLVEAHTFDLRGVPVRLVVVGPLAAQCLELRRGPMVVAVLGELRAGAWDLSAAGDAHQKALERVLPQVLVRAAAPEWAVEPSQLPAAPKGADLAQRNGAGPFLRSLR